MVLKDLPGGERYEENGGAYPNEETARRHEAIHRQIIAGVGVQVEGVTADVLAAAQASAVRAEAAASEAATVTADSAAQVSAAVARVGLREAPEPGSWAVGTDGRGKRLADAVTAAPPLRVEAPEPGLWYRGTDGRGQVVKQHAEAVSLQVEAPQAGLWYRGTDGRGARIGGETSQATTARVDVAASSTGVLVSTPEGVRPWTSDPSRIAAWGDSLTSGYPRPPFTAENSWPGVLDAAWSGTVYNGGVQGQTAQQIALRQGGLVLATAAPVTVPGDGSKAAISLAGAGIGAAYGYDFPGALAGRPVVLSHTVTDGVATGWQVRLAAAGDPLTVPSGAAFDPGTSAHADAVAIIYAGRNDMIGLTSSNAAERVARVLAATEMMVARLTPHRPRFLVVGTITSTSERRGSVVHDAVTAINTELAALYPAQWWSVQDYLAGPAIRDAGITPTQADLDALAGGTYPPSLSHDGLHYTTQAAALIAQQIKSQLTTRRYI